MKKIMLIFALVIGCGVSQGSATSSDRFATRKISVFCKNSAEIKGSEIVTENTSKAPTKKYYLTGSAFGDFIDKAFSILMAPLLYPVIGAYLVYGKLKTGKWPVIE